MWPPGPGLPQLACSGWFKKKKAELFPATSSCVLWISSDLRRVAALGNYMLSDATFVHSVWHFGCNKATKTKQWRRVGQSGRSGFMSTALWHIHVSLDNVYLLVDDSTFASTNNKYLEDSRANRLDLQWNAAAALQWTFDSADQFHDLVQFRADLCSSFVRKQPKKQNRRLLDCCIPVRLRTSAVHRACEGTRPSTYATQIVIMQWKSHRGAGWAPFRDTGRLLQAVFRLLVLLKTPLFP